MELPTLWIMTPCSCSQMLFVVFWVLGSTLCYAIQTPIQAQGDLKLPVQAADDVIDAGFSPQIQSFLRHLERMDRRSELSLLSIGTSHQLREVHSNMLFMVYSDSAFYQSRMKWVLDTWASKVPKSSIMVVGDKLDKTLGMRMHATMCPAHSHWEGACCKYAEAVIKARELLLEDPAIQWVYFTDDDAYIRPEAMKETLPKYDDTVSGVALGNWGCQTDKCSGGLCAGGGYAANRAAVISLVGNSSANFLREQMQNCNKCNKWADVALTQAIEARNIKKVAIPGLYGWALKKELFDQSLAPNGPQPLMYHYIRTQQQMEFLHNLFGNQNTTEKSLKHQLATTAPDACATFQGLTQCASSVYPGSVPWMV